MRGTLQPGNFFGEHLRIRELNGFRLSESLYANEQSIPRHTHPSPYLSVLLAGSYREICERRTRDCAPFTVVFHPAGETHADRFAGGGGRLFRIEITDLQRSSEVPTAPSEFAGGPVAWLAARLYAEFSQADPFSRLVMEGLALEIFGVTARQAFALGGDRRPQWLRRAEEFMRESAGHIRLSAIARIAGVHEVHLERVFRRFHRCTVGEYVRALRIDRAMRELRTSGKPLAVIAADAGFADQSHFCRSFKRSTGMTPGQYRRTFHRG